MNTKDSRLRVFTLAAIFSCAALLISSSILGDVIHFKDGRTLEGKILSEGSDSVQIRTKFGTVTIKRDRIAKIEHKESPEEIYQQKLDAVDRTDPDALFDLATWCKENGRKKEHRKWLSEIMKIDDQHDGANTELGNIQHDGKWFSAKGLESYKREKEEMMTNKGWVRYNGEWMPDIEAKKLMGYKEWEGEWVPLVEYYHRMGERDIPKTFGYSMTITDSEHFTIRSKNTENIHQEMLDYCELEYEHFIRTFEPNEVELRIISYYPIPVYILEDIDTCTKFVESGYIKRYNPPKEDMEKRDPENNFSIYFPRPLVVLSQGMHLVGADDELTSQIGFMAHHIGHILIRRFKRGGKVPGWIQSGVSHYYEGMANFHQTLSISEFRGYEDKMRWILGWGNFMEWKKKLIDKANHNSLPSVRQLFGLQIETITSKEMAKAWSITTYMIKHHRQEFVRFIRHTLAPYRGDKALSQDKAWTLCFKDKGITPEQIEKDWRAWIIEQPIAPSRQDRLKLEEKSDPLDFGGIPSESDK